MRVLLKALHQREVVILLPLNLKVLHQQLGAVPIRYALLRERLNLVLQALVLNDLADLLLLGDLLLVLHFVVRNAQVARSAESEEHLIN